MQLARLGLALAFASSFLAPRIAEAQREVWRMSYSPSGGYFEELSVVDDMDGDLFPDLLVKSRELPIYSTSRSYVDIHSGRTGGVLRTVWGATTGFTVARIAGGSDCNGDGRGDFFVSWVNTLASGFQERVLQVISPATPSFVVWDRRFSPNVIPGGLEIAGNHVSRCGDFDGDGVDDFLGSGIVNGTWRTLVLSGRTGQTLHEVNGHHDVYALPDLDGDLVPELVIGGIIFSGLSSNQLGAIGIGNEAVGIRNLAKPGFADLVLVEPQWLKRLGGAGLAEVWNVAPQGPAVRFVGNRATVMGDVDGDGVEDVLVRAQDASQQESTQAYSGATGSLLWSLRWLEPSGYYVLTGLRGYFARRERVGSQYSLALYAAIPEATPIPLRITPSGLDWRIGGQVEVSGIFPAATEIRIAGNALSSPVRVSATTIRGTVQPAIAPGLSIVEAVNGAASSRLPSTDFSFWPSLDAVVGGSASVGGFLRLELRGAPNRGAMLWLSTGYSPAPISVPPIAFHALTDPLVLIPIVFGGTDASGRLRLRIPFLPDPFLASQPMVIQGLALQAFPFDGSFTNAVAVAVPL